MAAPQYRHRHQTERARWAPTVNAGLAHCTEPVCLHTTRHIPPGAPWDLAHNRTTGGYHGPAHRRCNRAEGARWRHRKARLTAKQTSTPVDARPTNRWTL